MKYHKMMQGLIPEARFTKYLNDNQSKMKQGSMTYIRLQLIRVVTMLLFAILMPITSHFLLTTYHFKRTTPAYILYLASAMFLSSVVVIKNLKGNLLDEKNKSNKSYYILKLSYYSDMILFLGLFIVAVFVTVKYGWGT